MAKKRNASGVWGKDFEALIESMLEVVGKRAGWEDVEKNPWFAKEACSSEKVRAYMDSLRKFV